MLDLQLHFDFQPAASGASVHLFQVFCLLGAFIILATRKMSKKAQLKSQIPTLSPRPWVTQSERSGQVRASPTERTYTEIYQKSRATSGRVTGSGHVSSSSIPSPRVWTGAKTSIKPASALDHTNDTTTNCNRQINSKNSYATFTNKMLAFTALQRKDKRSLGENGPGDCVELERAAVATDNEKNLLNVHSEGDYMANNGRSMKIDNVTVEEKDVSVTEIYYSLDPKNKSSTSLFEFEHGDCCKSKISSGDWETDSSKPLQSSRTVTLVKGPDGETQFEGEQGDFDESVEEPIEEATTTAALFGGQQGLSEIEEWLEKATIPLDENGNIDEESFHSYYSPLFKGTERSSLLNESNENQQIIPGQRFDPIANTRAEGIQTETGIKKKRRTHKVRKPVNVSKKWESKEYVDPVQYHNALDTPSYVFLEKGTHNKFVGKLTIENMSDQFYGYKVTCNKAAYEKYLVTPKAYCIGPYQAVHVVIRAKGRTLTPFLASGDVFTIKRYRLPKFVEVPELNEHMKQMSLRHPELLEKSQVMPIILEGGYSDFIDIVEFSDARDNLKGTWGKYKQEILFPKRRFGINLNAVSQHLSTMMILVKRQSDQFMFLSTQAQVVFTVLAMGFCVSFIFSFFFKDKDEFTIPEMEVESGSWFY